MHNEEEILVPLWGEIDLILVGEKDSEAIRRIRLKPGQGVYYPAHYPHSLQTVSVVPANYLMLKWVNAPQKAGSGMASRQFNLFDEKKDSAENAGFCPRLVFEGATVYLKKLHCHTSTLLPGAGYDEHIDDYDVVLVILEGEVETLGERAGPHSVVFYPAGKPHGLVNPGEVTARYLVFEFHAWPIGLKYILKSGLRACLAKAKGSLAGNHT